MNPEDKALLEKIYKMTEENNTILKSIHRTNKIGLTIKVLYWVIILGLSFGAFYFVQPYVNTLTGVLDNSGGTNKTGVSPYNSYTENIMDLLK